MKITKHISLIFCFRCEHDLEIFSEDESSQVDDETSVVEVVGFNFVGEAKELEVEGTDVGVWVVEEFFDDAVGGDEVLVEELGVDGGVVEERGGGGQAAVVLEGDALGGEDVGEAGVGDLELGHGWERGRRYYF